MQDGIVSGQQRNLLFAGVREALRQCQGPRGSPLHRHRGHGERVHLPPARRAKDLQAIQRDRRASQVAHDHRTRGCHGFLAQDQLSRLLQGWWFCNFYRVVQLDFTPKLKHLAHLIVKMKKVANTIHTLSCIRDGL